MATVRVISGFEADRAFDSDSSIAELVMELNPKTGTWEVPVVCLVNNEPVLRKDWSLRPASKDVVEFVVLPMGGGGGGSNPLALILTVIIGVVAFWAAGFVTSALGLTTGTMAAGGTFLGNLVFGLTAGLIMAAGSLLMGAIFKTPSQPTGHLDAARNEAASPTYGLNAANNQARLYQPVGEAFGRIKIVPDRAAQAYGVYVGDEMYLYQVFALGRGSYSIESMAFGDTVFWRNGALVSGYDVQVQILEPGQSVTLFPDNVETSIEVSSQQLFSTEDPEYNGPIGPFSCNPPGTTTTQIICSVVCPQGVGKYDDNGKLQSESVKIKFELRRIDDNGVPVGSWVTGATTTIAEATMTPQRRSIKMNTTAGRWECRVGRTDDIDASGGRVLQACVWETMVAVLPGSLTYNQSVVAMSVRATNELSQQAASTFSIVYTRKLPIYNPATKTWSAPQATRKFSAAISSVLRCEWGGALPDDRIDLDGLWGAVEPLLTQRGWTFDGYFDGSYTVWSLIVEMCQAFRVVPRLGNGSVMFVFDQPGRPVRHVFTPRDIIRGSLSIVYNTYTDNTPDNIVWNYIDESAGFQQREVRAELPGSETKNPVIKSFIGCVNRTQAFRMGVFACACNRHRRIQLTFRVEGQGRLLSMGDVCAVEHPYFTNLGTGVVEGWDASRLAIDVGTEVSGYDPLRVYYMALNKPNGSPWGPCRVRSYSGREIILDDADYATLIGQGAGSPFEFMEGRDSGMPNVWTMHDSRTYSGRVIIQSVVPSSMYQYEITAVNDSDEVDNYGHLTVPIWQYRDQDSNTGLILTMPDGFSPVLEGTAASPVLQLTWLPVTGATSYEIQTMPDGSSSYGNSRTTAVNFLQMTLAPGVTAIRVRALRSPSGIGPWGVYEVDTRKAFVDPVLFTDTTYAGGDLTLAWQLPVYAGLSDVEAELYELTIKDPDGKIRRTTTIQGTEAGYEYLKSMAMADGAMKRTVNVSMVAKLRASDGQGGYRSLTTTPAVESITDEAPQLSGDLDVTIGSTSITLQALAVEGETTGFAVVRGDTADFELQGIVELRLAGGVPWTWTGLQPDTDYHFRVAAKDALADLLSYYLDLNWSGVFTLHTAAA